MKNYLLLILIFILPSSFLFACFCGPIPTFCETITLGGNSSVIPDFFTIVQVEIINKKTDGVDIKIESVLFGTTTAEELFIKRGSESFCSIDTDIFSEGEFYIFNLEEIDSLDNLYLWDCGVNYLKIENGNVIGPIAPDVELIPLGEFDPTDCIESVTVSTSDVTSLEAALKVFPNPTHGNFSILNLTEIKDFQSVEIELVDLQGRVIYVAQKTEGWLSNEAWKINVSEIANGVYFLKIYSEKQRAVFKIVKI